MIGRKSLLTLALFAFGIPTIYLAAHGQTSHADGTIPTVAAASASQPVQPPAMEEPAVDLDAYLQRAGEALAGGNLLLADQCCQIVVQHDLACVPALDLWASVRRQRIDLLLARLEPLDRLSLRAAYTEAGKLWAEVTDRIHLLQEIDVQRPQLGDRDRCRLCALSQEVAQYGARFALARRCAFNRFAWDEIGKAKSLYNAGKGRIYDDKERLQKALVELNIAANVLDQIDEPVKRVIGEWHNTIKGDLNKRQYDEAMQLSRLVIEGGKAH